MQLSNDVAERLAAELVASGKGAFELCGFVAGGKEPKCYPAFEAA